MSARFRTEGEVAAKPMGGDQFTRFTPDECRKRLAAAGYDAHDPT